MFDATSRYAFIEQATTEIRNSDGTTRVARYVKRRFIPPVDDGLVIAEHTVTQEERLDTITAIYLGDPLQFWRICDANNVLAPAELEEVGTVIKINFTT
ncbi:MAG: LysM domain-containing protein [Chloroflexota bacterium]|nr:LysM domain-containing protein [Chloroflexota bacterium]